MQGVARGRLVLGRRVVRAHGPRSGPLVLSTAGYISLPTVVNPLTPPVYCDIATTASYTGVDRRVPDVAAAPVLHPIPSSPQRRGLGGHQDQRQHDNESRVRAGTVPVALHLDRVSSSKYFPICDSLKQPHQTSYTGAHGHHGHHRSHASTHDAQTMCWGGGGAGTNIKSHFTRIPFPCA